MKCFMLVLQKLQNSSISANLCARGTYNISIQNFWLTWLKLWICNQVHHHYILFVQKCNLVNGPRLIWDSWTTKNCLHKGNFWIGSHFWISTIFISCVGQYSVRSWPLYILTYWKWISFCSPHKTNIYTHIFYSSHLTNFSTIRKFEALNVYVPGKTKLFIICCLINFGHSNFLKYSSHPRIIRR